MFSILYNIIISPIELVVEFVFEIMFRMVGQRETNQGLAVIGVSVAISLLTLPLYYRADAVQQKERDLNKRLSRWTKHIRNTFKGDERFMMQQAYYRENGYSPLQALNGSISLLLEIPFFIAAYHFLSNLTVLNGASFGPIENLGAPDHLIKIGSFNINLLPVLMTTINCISSAIYLKGFPIKDKIQTYGMALIFLVLLYNSPSGLVVYWTCNNIFGLVKNIFYKLKNPKKVAVILIAILGSFLTILAILSGKLTSRNRYAFIILFQYLCLLPFFCYILRNQIRNIYSKFSLQNKSQNNSSAVLFILSGIIMTLLTGVLIPSGVIVTSPAEFVDVNNYVNPLRSLINSTCYAAGFFFLWIGIIYKMLDKKYQGSFSKIYFVFALISIVNYMFFSGKLGNLSPFLKFDNAPVFSLTAKAFNLLIILLIICAFYFLFKFKISKKIFNYSGIVIVICISFLGILNISKIQKHLNSMEYIKNISDKKSGSENIEPIIHLNRNGKNVIVFMLDRAINLYYPLCMDEYPELKEQFAGFTYYPNTISHGGHTVFGAVPLFGGYEYTPQAINDVPGKTLVQKHNEALKLMPVIFNDNGFEVTVCDPPLANYQWIPDVSIYSEYPEINAHITKAMYTDYLLEKYDLSYMDFKYNKRNFFCYGLFNIAPLLFKSMVYDHGDYYNSQLVNRFDKNFFDDYSVLEFLPELTEISDEEKNTFFMIDNDTTHDPCLLYSPDYTLTPPQNVSSTHKDREFETNAQLIHYHVNMLTYKTLGKWFDYLRKNNVWDNTKIIIVSDHGYSNDFDDMSLMYSKELLLDEYQFDAMLVNALLIVKDFNSTEFTTSNEFMTNGDVPSIAFKDVIENPVNPFTGNKINTEEKTAHPQLITTSHKYSQNENDRVFDTMDGYWFSVHDDIFNKDNWEFVAK